MFSISGRVLILIFFLPLFLIGQNLQGEGFVNENNNRLFVSDSLKAPNTFQYIASRSPIILDYNFVDFPFSKKSIELSGFGGLFANPSMSQSLNISSSFYSATREGLYRLKSKKQPGRYDTYGGGRYRGRVYVSKQNE